METLTPIRLRYTGEVIDLTTAYDDQEVVHTEPVELRASVLNTTVGRAILNDHLPERMPFINGLLKKKGIGQLVNYCYLRFGLETTVTMLDKIKTLGFRFATRAGLSIGIDDMVIPPSKKELVDDAEKEVVERPAAVSGRRDHQRRTLQQGHRNLVGDHRKGRRQDVRGHGARRQGRRDQSDLRHGRLRRSRIETADSSALRYARIDGQAVGRNHRNADHGKLPRRSDGAAVLHLDARRS